MGQRVDYVSGSVVAHSPRDERSRWEVRISGANRESLKTAVAVWYGASKLTRSVFRQKLLDPNTSDETVDQLRAAAKGIVDARTHAQLAIAGESLATAAQSVGLYSWPGFLGDAERKGVRAVTEGAIPGVTNASFVTGDPRVTALGIILGLVILGYQYLTGQHTGPSRSAVSPTQPTTVPQVPLKDDKAGQPSAASPPAGSAPDLMPGPGGVVVSDDRRKHILDGDDKGGGGHGAGRNRPNKSEFPSGWSDEQAIDAIKDVANDPGSSREIEPDGRIKVSGTRNGVDIRVIVESDKNTVVTGYPTNLPRNPKGER